MTGWLWYIGAVMLGISLGWLTATLFLISRKSVTTADYFYTLVENLKSLLSLSAPHFWLYYRNILVISVKYILSQARVIVLALVPMVAFFFGIFPHLQILYNHSLPVHIHYGGSIGILGNNDKPVYLDSENELRIIKTIASDSLIFQQYGEIIMKIPYKGRNLAICKQNVSSHLLLSSLGFQVLNASIRVKQDQHSIIIRGYRGDINPFWPFLNDPEFIFWISFLGWSAITVFANTRNNKSNKTKGIQLSKLDFLLTAAATSYSGFFERLGKWESTHYSQKLDPISIDRPVYISGLARSGTTILLELFAQANEVATHRYRDFPFIMCPILWHRFLTLFAKSQLPIERPHQDRILITRESPEAFEEPLWQHFFPHVHDPRELHQINDSPAIEQFNSYYKSHIQKILYLRKGKRYVSKGNYLFTRINEIVRIFPDARFIIPIRHPLWHIDSLTRQHKLFVKYSNENPMVAVYLKAAGHYEFGPQRCPINLNQEDRLLTQEAWEQGNEYAGYAYQWRGVYRAIHRMMELNPNIRDHIHIVRYEDICQNPEKLVKEIFDFSQLNINPSIASAVSQFSMPKRAISLNQSEQNQCWEIVKTVAQLYNYHDMVLKI